MDIYDYLKMDHKEVAKLFDLYKTASTDKNKLEIFNLIKKELIVHADSEAATFYKRLEDFIKSEDQAFHGEEEHEEIKDKLEEISAFKTVTPTMDKKIEELKKLVEHHVSDEEGKIFRAAKKVLSDEEAWVLKEKMHDLKEKILNGYKIAKKESIE